MGCAAGGCDGSRLLCAADSAHHIPLRRGPGEVDGEQALAVARHEQQGRGGVGEQRQVDGGRGGDRSKPGVGPRVRRVARAVCDLGVVVDVGGVVNAHSSVASCNEEPVALRPEKQLLCLPNRTFAATNLKWRHRIGDVEDDEGTGFARQRQISVPSRRIHDHAVNAGILWSKPKPKVCRLCGIGHIHAPDAPLEGGYPEHVTRPRMRRSNLQQRAARL